MSKIDKINSSKEKNSKLSHILKYLPIFLALTFADLPPNVAWNTPINNKSEISIWQDNYKKDLLENIDIANNIETIFKNGIRNSLKNIKNINDIPHWWITIHYNLWSSWMTKEYIQSLNLPNKFDITPRNSKEWMSGIIFHLWNRNFKITLKSYVWKIKTFALTEKWFEIQTTFGISTIEDRQKWLPNFIYNLRKSPPWKGEKTWFAGITVVEL